MLFMQQGVCYICKEECSSGHKLSVDHSHETGEVRALLCKSCNYLVGLVENKSNLIDEVAKYIQQGGDYYRT
jgi:hypothetical protein